MRVPWCLGAMRVPWCLGAMRVPWCHACALVPRCRACAGLLRASRHMRKAGMQAQAPPWRPAAAVASPVLTYWPSQALHPFWPMRGIGQSLHVAVIPACVCLWDHRGCGLTGTVRACFLVLATMMLAGASSAQRPLTPTGWPKPLAGGARQSRPPSRS